MVIPPNTWYLGRPKSTPRPAHHMLSICCAIKRDMHPKIAPAHRKSKVASMGQTQVHNPNGISTVHPFWGRLADRHRLRYTYSNILHLEQAFRFRTVHRIFFLCSTRKWDKYPKITLFPEAISPQTKAWRLGITQTASRWFIRFCITQETDRHWSCYIHSNRPHLMPCIATRHRNVGDINNGNKNNKE